MNKLKQILDNYEQPTPKKMRRLGDALLIASSTLSSYQVLNDNETVGVIIIVIGVAGKFLTNLFRENAIK